MKTLKLTVIAFSVIALGACGGKSKTVETKEKQDAAKAAAGAQTFQVESSSTLGWVGKKVGGQHNGQIVISAGELKAEGGELKAGTFTIDMNSITVLDITDAKKNAGLVDHLKNEDFFETSAYPTATFEITGVEKSTEAGATHNVKGNLTLKGVTKNITIPANVTITGDQLTATAKFAIDSKQWNVKYDKSGNPLDKLKDAGISDAIELELNLKAKAIAS